MAAQAPGQTPGINGYQGLGSIFSLLQGGINQGQMDHLAAGATGANGMAVGGAHGAFGGLSPYATHFLATSGLLQKVAGQPTTGPDGQPLTGSALLMATLMNQLQPTQYKLADGITQDNLSQLLGLGFDGHSGYAKGFDASGPIPGQGGQPPVFHPPGPHRQPPGHRGDQGGPVHAGGGHPPIFTGQGSHGTGQGHHGILPFRTVGGGDRNGRPNRHPMPAGPGRRRVGSGSGILKFPVRH